ncbi:hypothetical protein HELRODRAFT_191395 [Helobdella robusta]|uniref:LIM zinc-binding domain-containing protein n=1 Tax=Helobdella robusta TaxID=6412 RepID=T1FSY4_HELRO|nr:hypothetical protein HELRODRAFT_191395 [Helobdella robusta]ESO05180.1 hypothetical protein HELRODRAFT_191395 [Helobdella robusta]
MGKYTCEACKKKCKKEAIRLQEKYFHLECFNCSECHKQLSMNGFYTRNNLHYCPEDYQRLFSVKCDACGELAEGEVMTVLGNKLFEPGEKVTFSKNISLCSSCCKLEEMNSVSGTPSTLGPMKQDSSLKQDSSMESKQSSHPLSSMSKPTSPIIQNGSIPNQQPAALLNGGLVNGVEKSKASSRSLPRIFGMPDNRFYNISYLERTQYNNFRRGPVQSATEHSTTHYHRPGYMEKMTFAKRSETSEALMPIERDDWPGPPEPAAAYPELLREKFFLKPTSGAEFVNVEGEEAKRIGELQKMSRESGTAAVFLKELQNLKKEGSPNLDPRNASRTPSAAVEPLHKPRYETPYYASPSRYLDMLPHRSKSTDNSMRNKPKVEDVVRPYTSLAIRTGSSLNTSLPYRVGSSMEARRRYTPLDSSIYGDDDDDRYSSRPQSAVDGLEPGRFSSLRVGEIDPDTGLRQSKHMRAATLPIGLTGFSNFTKLTAVGLKSAEPVKVYPYEQLLQINSKPLPGVNRNALENHLSKEEFHTLFQMDAHEFFQLPPWQRNELKIKVGLM